MKASPYRIRYMEVCLKMPKIVNNISIYSGDGIGLSDINTNFPDILQKAQYGFYYSASLNTSSPLLKSTAPIYGAVAPIAKAGAPVYGANVLKPGAVASCFGAIDFLPRASEFNPKTFDSGFGEVVSDFEATVLNNGAFGYKKEEVGFKTEKFDCNRNKPDIMSLIWNEIGRAASSPFVDMRVNQTNKPETRHYKMRYIVKEVPIGKDSDTINVVSVVGVDLANKLK